ncbi:hypothetical protein A2239_04225 [Candidatus Uhrbacteria bacterium RIFOXYA2_FULL_40_9]|nr:MAG: hypothetical protein A2239_04225 [Candidatus Uhrbacteria bacterium RIFOXYA2_FULL_40_9]
MPNYPYLPEGRTFLFVPESHPFMQEAQRARAERAGDPIWPNGAVLVKDGKVIASAGNGYNRGSHLIHICPRIVHECPSGEGYDLCGLHNNPGHAEQMVIDVAHEAGIETEGADLYMYGHWWCCQPCWDKMIEAGIRNVYLPEGADELFTREKVHAPYLEPSIKKAYVHIGSKDEKLALLISEVCQGIGCEAIFSDFSLDGGDERQYFEQLHRHLSDQEVIIIDVSTVSFDLMSELLVAHRLAKPIVLLSQKDLGVKRFFHDHPSVVYHVEYEDLDQAARMLKNVLIQL